MARVVVTGLGLVCALGGDLATCWPRLMSGEHGIAPIARFDASAYPARLAAQVTGTSFDAASTATGSLGAQRLGVQLFLRSVREACADADMSTAAYLPERVGVAAGASVNYLHMGRLREAWRHRTPDGRRLDLARYASEVEHPREDLLRRMGEAFAAWPAREVGALGPRLVIDTACAAGASAIGEAFRMIRRGRAAAMIAGGGCAMVMPLGILAFSRIGALTPSTVPDEASRPFDRRRDGFVMGEAAGALVLESFDAARRRGARIYAELAGYGATTSAASLTDPSADGQPEARAMALALADGGLAAGEIDYVAAHGTSTPRNDAIETLAIRRALGERATAVAVSSNKGQIGHALAAAGAVNAVIAAVAIARGEVPPTANYRTPDPRCDLDYVPNEGRRLHVGAALANAFAFGGHNVSLAFRAIS